MIEAIAAEVLLDFAQRLFETGEYPAFCLGDRGPDGCGYLAFGHVHEHEARRVPQLIAEGFVALGALDVEIDRAAVAGQRGEGEAQGVGADRGNAVGIILADALFDFLAHLRNQQ